MSSAPTPKELLETLRGFIHDARACIAEGGEVDLAGVDAKVQELCDRVLEMPVGEAREIQAGLDELGESFAALRQEMIASQEQVRGQIDALNKREKAAKAYRKSDAIGAVEPPSDSDE